MKLFTIRRHRWLVKFFVFIPLIIVVLLNVRLIDQVKDFNQQVYLEESLQISKINLSSIIELDSVQKNKNRTENVFLKKFVNDVNLNPKIRNKHFIDSLLNEQKLMKNLLSDKNNKNLKKTYQAPKFLVILIQVHSRLNYLKELIESLKETKYIEQTLVIFSHDIINNEMNDLINSIDFCATLQIFYPFSLQIYPDSFPGKDPNDCPIKIGKKKAIIAKCNNAYEPDSFGNYREHSIVQIKHHWFWKLGYTFEQLNETRDLENLQVLLLEEDYFLFPDAIHTLRKLSQKCLSDIDVVSLAVFDKQKQNLDIKLVKRYSKAIWHSSAHNTGLMIGRAQWKMIKDCLNAFCTYDDYNWDWTLQFISQTCFKLPLVSIFPDLSRVVHIGECGTHHKGKNCDPQEKVKNLKNNFNSNKLKYFPDNFEIGKINTAIRKVKKSNGGWSDKRDHSLCKSFASHVSARNNLTIFI